MDGAIAWDTVVSLTSSAIDRCTTTHRDLDFTVLDRDERFYTAASSIKPSSRLFLGQFLTDSLFLPFIKLSSENLLMVCFIS